MSQINSADQSENDSTSYEYDEENMFDHDLVTINLRTNNIQLKYSQLCKYSLLIAEKYVIKDVKERLSEEIQQFIAENNLDDEHIIYFFKLFNDEKVKITNDKYRSFFKISSFLQVNSFLKRLKKYEKMHFKDIDFIITTILEEITNQNSNEKDEYELQFQMEQYLTDQVNECFLNKKFKNFPVSLIYQIIDKSDKSQISSDLLFDFINESIDEFFVLFSFIDIQKLSFEKIQNFYSIFHNSNNENMKRYLQYIPFTFEYIQIVKDLKEKNKEYEISLKQKEEENLNFQNQVNLLLQENQNYKENLIKQESIAKNQQIEIINLKNKYQKIKNENKNLQNQIEKVIKENENLLKKNNQLKEGLNNLTISDKNNLNDLNLYYPIEQFLIKDENGFNVSFSEAANKKQICVMILPPKFIFKMKNCQFKVEIYVKRGQKVKYIKKEIINKFNLGKYDFYLKINNDVLNDDDDFDKYQKNDKQFFIVTPRNPFYSFRLKIGPDKSQPKKFSFDPSTTILQVKSIILPQISSKRLAILFDDKVLNDYSKLEEFDSNGKELFIFLKDIKVKVILPKILKCKPISIFVKESNSIKEIKSCLIAEYEKLKNYEIGLYLSNKELNDELKISDIIFIKKFEIECKILFNFICTQESVIKFDNFKEIFYDEITVNDCKIKCLNEINKNSSTKLKNIDRISIKINGENQPKNNEDKIIDYINFDKTFKEIQITVLKDKKFINIKNDDKHYKDIFNKFYSESNVEEIRKKIGNDFIIKSDQTNSVVFDDTPLFSIQGQIYTENINKAKKIKINFLDGINKELKITSETMFCLTSDTTVYDLKQEINDNKAFENTRIIDFEIAIIHNDDDDEKLSPADFKRKLKILYDSQNLFTFKEKNIYVTKKNIIFYPSSHLSLIYINKNNETAEICVEYNEETTVEDLLKKIEFDVDEDSFYNKKQVVLYMGKIQSLNAKLKDIIFSDNPRFYSRMIQMTNDE